MRAQLPRPTSDDERRDLKLMTRAALRLVRASKFALVTRASETQLSNYGSDSAEHAERFMPVDVLADLQKELPRGVASPLLEALAALGGLRLVAADEDDGGDGASLDDIGRVAKEGGEAKAASLRSIGSACLATVATARREVGEARDEYSGLYRKVLAHELRLSRRASA